MSGHSGVLLCDLHFSTQSAAEEDDLRLKKFAHGGLCMCCLLLNLLL